MRDAKLRPARAPSRWPALVVVAVLGVAAALGCAEAALRAAGFSFHTFPIVQFGYPDPVTIRDLFVPDRDLFWVTRDYAATLEGARRSHPAVVFMGDSCTQFGSYPTMTLALLSTSAPDLAAGVKVGVVGWSSEQGLTQLKRDILPLEPRVITIYFGWNDHWVALGRPDAEAHPNAVVWWLADHSRVWQLMAKAENSIPVRLADRPNRVDLSRYGANLMTMVSLALKIDAGVVLITAPSGHESGHEPEYLARRFVRQLSDLVPLHQAYVQATRDAARKSGAVLCDAAATFAADPARRQYFERDGIHLTRAGNRALADVLAPCVVAAGRARSSRHALR